jgi:hypothetical protein
MKTKLRQQIKNWFFTQQEYYKAELMAFYAPNEGCIFPKQNKWFELKVWLWVRTGLREIYFQLIERCICNKWGHKIKNEGSEATPNYGYEDFSCSRCGRYWHINYY